MVVGYLFMHMLKAYTSIVVFSKTLIVLLDFGIQ